MFLQVHVCNVHCFTEFHCCSSPGRSEQSGSWIHCCGPGADLRCQALGGRQSGGYPQPHLPSHFQVLVGKRWTLFDAVQTVEPYSVGTK